MRMLMTCLVTKCNSKGLRRHKALDSYSEGDRFKSHRETKVDYHVHERPSMIPVLNQINSVHTSPSYLSNNHFNITSTFTLVFLVVPSFLTFPPISYMDSSFTHSCCTPCPSYPSWLHNSNYTWRRVQITKLLII
jgi:hypothetical protein